MSQTHPIPDHKRDTAEKKLTKKEAYADEPLSSAVYKL